MGTVWKLPGALAPKLAKAFFPFKDIFNLDNAKNLYSKFQENLKKRLGVSGKPNPIGTNRLTN